MPNITFVMLKPDAIERNLVYTTLSYFEKNGIYAKCFDLQKVDTERIKRHYGEHIQKFGPSFEKATLNTFEGKYVIPCVLTGEGDVIARVREIVGATQPEKAAKGTIRGDLGLDDNYEKAGMENRMVNNLIHASDCTEAVIREIGIWLPEYKLDKMKASLKKG